MAAKARTCQLDGQSKKTSGSSAADTVASTRSNAVADLGCTRPHTPDAYTPRNSGSGGTKCHKETERSFTLLRAALFTSKRGSAHPLVLVPRPYLVPFICLFSISDSNKSQIRIATFQLVRQDGQIGQTLTDNATDAERLNEAVEKFQSRPVSFFIRPPDPPDPQSGPQFA